MADIKFKFSPRKAFAAIHWMAAQGQPVDLHAALKTCYFADVDMLNLYNRPVFGATYKAMRFGPVPLEIYEMVKSEPLWLAELGVESFPWELRGHTIRIRENREPDLSALSPADLKSLQAAFQMSVNMTFDERTAATHGQDWQRANLGEMKYEDMLFEAENRDEVIAFLQENSRFMKL